MTLEGSDVQVETEVTIGAGSQEHRASSLPPTADKALEKAERDPETCTASSIPKFKCAQFNGMPNSEHEQLVFINTF